jgi:hypothetical protein
MIKNLTLSSKSKPLKTITKKVEGISFKRRLILFSLLSCFSIKIPRIHLVQTPDKKFDTWKNAQISLAVVKC